MSNKRNISPYESVLALVLLLLLIQYFFPHKLWLPITLGVVFICLLSKAVTNAIHWAWQKITLGIGWVMSKLLLGAVFFVLLTPLAFLYRLFRKSGKERMDSNFVERNYTFKSDDLANPW